MTASKIEWTGRSDWNPIRGCTRASEGCGSARGGGCYAEIMAARFSYPADDKRPAGWGHGFAHMVDGDHRWTGKVELQADRLALPLRWRNPGFVFPTSTSDPFHEALTDDEINSLLAIMAMTPHLTYQLLTKRAKRMREHLSRPHAHADMLDAASHIAAASREQMITAHCATWPLPNLWTGTSVEDQRAADDRVPELLATPSAMRWLSCEPLIGAIDLRMIYLRRDGQTATFLSNRLGDYVQPLRGNFTDSPRINWIVVGGESGPGARDNDFLSNARGLRDQCRETGTAFFGKQGFRKAELPADLQIREMP